MPELNADVSLNGIRYPLVMNKGVLAYREGDSISIQDGDPSVPVGVQWPIMVPGGMGETKKIAEGSAGCAFSVSMDTSPYGFTRLSGRPVTVTPDSAPVDEPTFGFEDAPPAGAFVESVSNFSTTADTSPHAITHGLSVAPKAIIFWTGGATATGTVTAGSTASIGVTDGTRSRAVGWNVEDAAATTNTGRQYESGVLCFPTNAGVAGPIATISSIGATTFSVTFNSAPAANIVVHFKALGGPDVQAYVKEWAMNTSTGNQSVTGVGFQPTAVVHIGGHRTATGATTTANMTLGAMDASGNQWVVAIEDPDALADAAPVSQLSITKCFLQYVSQATDAYATYVSMDVDGFTVNIGDAPVAADLVGSLCLKGMQVKAGSTTKKTSSGNQAAVTTGFTTTGFLVTSVAGISTGAFGATTFSLGAASGTSAVEAMCWSSEDGATSDTYSVDDTALAMEIIDYTDGSEDNLATCGAIDMQTAGWLNWSASDARADYIAYLAFAPLAAGASSYIYALNGQRSTKMSRSSGGGAIAVAEQKDFGNGAQLGAPTKYGTATAKWHVPLGEATATMYAQTLDTISGSSTDTWAALGTNRALGFATTVQGSTAALVRAHSGNKVDISTDGTTFGADFDVGNKSETITNIRDSGSVLFISTDSNLHEFDISGLTRKLTRFQVSDKNDNFGSGMMVPAGSEVAFFNHRGLYFWNGERAPQVGPDANSLNRAIANVTHEPFRVEHLETVYGSDDWVWSAARVTESSVTYTYVMAGNRRGDNITWHAYHRFSGTARLVPIDGALDSNHCLWFAHVSGGTFGYFQLGPNGEPDAGRDAIGFGMISSTYQLYMSRTDLGLPHTPKTLHYVEVKTLGIDTTCPVQVYALTDHGVAGAVGSTITTPGVSERFWSNTTGTSTATSATTLTDGAAAWTVNQFNGWLAKSGDSRATILSNTATVVTVGAWTGGTPATGTYTLIPSCRDVMLLLQIDTTSGYVNTTADPQFLSVILRAMARPTGARVFNMTISTVKRHGNDGEQLGDSIAILSALQALERGAPVTFIDPNGNSVSVTITSVSASPNSVDHEVGFDIDVSGTLWSTS